MLRKNKDNYFIIVLIIVSITMLFTICSSDTVADSIVNNHDQKIIE